MSKHFITAVALLIAVAAFAYRPVAEAQQMPGAQRWEYKTVPFNGNGPQFVDSLNALGKEGWEVVTSAVTATSGDQAAAILKRPLR